MTISVFIPGTPAAQGRPKASEFQGRARVYEDAKSRNAKAVARDAIVRELEARGVPMPAFGVDAVRVTVTCVWDWPRSTYRKRDPRQAGWRPKKPDADNLAKLYLDAASGLLWKDDNQVVQLTVGKRYGDQGCLEGVTLTVEAVACSI